MKTDDWSRDLITRTGLTFHVRPAKVNGDRYGGEWVTDAFRKAGIYYAPSEKVKSQLYLDLLPLVNATACVLLDDDRLVRQLISLERRVGRGTGRDIIRELESETMTTTDPFPPCSKA